MTEKNTRNIGNNVIRVLWYEDGNPNDKIFSKQDSASGLEQFNQLYSKISQAENIGQVFISQLKKGFGVPMSVEDARLLLTNEVFDLRLEWRDVDTNSPQTLLFSSQNPESVNELQRKYWSLINSHHEAKIFAIEDPETEHEVNLQIAVALLGV